MPAFFFHIAFDLGKAHGQTDTTAKVSELLNPDIAKPHTLSKVFEGTSNSGTTSSGININPGATRPQLSDDWRYSKVSVQNITMAAIDTGGGQDSPPRIVNGINAGPAGSATKGRYEPLDGEEEDVGWGIVRLYRDSEETQGLYDEPASTKHHKHGRHTANDENRAPRLRDEDCTTLCILAVPSYLTPSDFLGFVGEKTRDEVSHFRMIRTERGNRYMVLMKFRSGKRAREWRREWNGKAFDGMEPENCHVVFIKSIQFRTTQHLDQESSFPDMTNDPFTPSITATSPPTSTSTLTSTSAPPPLPSTSRTSKPHAPPTPALIELPTCPVCLERMDESTGLLTILCQHVFHCHCLQKWRGSGCPVCRYTQHETGLGKRTGPGGGSSSAEIEAPLNECSVCRSESNLWMCLICGNVGCGRYDDAHAYAHYEQTAHCYAMDMGTQRIWDYGSDGYVHRIVQDKQGGKIGELVPGERDRTGDSHDDDEYVPRGKVDAIALEYTHLLASQLDSQRLYFEEILERAADKASHASAAAETAVTASTDTGERLARLQEEYDTLILETVPSLERERDRAARRAEKFEGLARRLEGEWRDEKAMGESLVRRVEGLREEVGALKLERDGLEEEKRDLAAFISGVEVLKRSGVAEEELEGGVVSIGEGKGTRKKKAGKEKGKK